MTHKEKARNIEDGGREADRDTAYLSTGQGKNLIAVDSPLL